jgi:hypothetical protein
MEAVQTVEPSRNPPTFESVWTALQETDRIIKENAHRQEETTREMQERARQQEEYYREMRESTREMKEAQKETDRQIKEYNKRFGDFTKRFGEVVEYMIAPNLCEKFRELGYNFPQSHSGTRVEDYTNKIHFEIDVKLENGDRAMLVEVKTKLTTEHINEHIERLEKMRKYADLHGDKRSFIGAVAGVVMTPNVKDYALKQGFFVVEPSGETFTIIPPDNKPKEW